MDERWRSGVSAPSADRVPTLTEVLELDQALDAVDEVEAAPAPAPAPAQTVEPTPITTPTPADLDAVVARVVEALLPALDAMLQERLFEALAPSLERAAEQIVRDSRTQLAITLHQCVQETVAQVLQPAPAAQG